MLETLFMLVGGYAIGYAIGYVSYIAIKDRRTNRAERYDYKSVKGGK